LIVFFSLLFAKIIELFLLDRKYSSLKEICSICQIYIIIIIIWR